MTSTHPAHAGGLDADRLLWPAAGVVTLVSIGFHALGVWGDGSPGAEPVVGDFLIVSAITLLAVGLVFGLLLPRVLHHSSATTVAVVLGVAALASIPVFWLGLTLVLAVAAILLGLEHRADDQGAGAAKAALALGAVATLGYLVGYIGDWLSTNGYM